MNKISGYRVKTQVQLHFYAGNEQSKNEIKKIVPSIHNNIKKNKKFKVKFNKVQNYTLKTIRHCGVFSFIFFPVLLRYNWNMALYKLYWDIIDIWHCINDHSKFSEHPSSHEIKSKRKIFPCDENFQDPCSQQLSYITYKQGWYLSCCILHPYYLFIL